MAVDIDEGGGHCFCQDQCTQCLGKGSYDLAIMKGFGRLPCSCGGGDETCGNDDEYETCDGGDDDDDDDEVASDDDDEVATILIICGIVVGAICCIGCICTVAYLYYNQNFGQPKPDPNLSPQQGGSGSRTTELPVVSTSVVPTVVTTVQADHQIAESTIQNGSSSTEGQGGNFNKFV